MNCDLCKQNKTGLFWVSTSSVTYCKTLDSLLWETLTAALQVTNSDLGNIQMVDENHVLRIRVQVGFQSEFLEFFSGVQEHEAACGTAAASRRTVVVEDVERSPIFAGTPALKILLNAGVRAVQSTPMFDPAGELVGMVSTHFRKPRRFSGYELDPLGHLAAQAAGCIETLIPLER